MTTTTNPSRFVVLYDFNPDEITKEGLAVIAIDPFTAIKAAFVIDTLCKVSSYTDPHISALIDVLAMAQPYKADPLDDGTP